MCARIVPLIFCYNFGVLPAHCTGPCWIILVCSELDKIVPYFFLRSEVSKAPSFSIPDYQTALLKAFFNLKGCELDRDKKRTFASYVCRIVNYTNVGYAGSRRVNSDRLYPLGAGFVWEVFRWSFFEENSSKKLSTKTRKLFEWRTRGRPPIQAIISEASDIDEPEFWLGPRNKYWTFFTRFMGLDFRF